MKFFLIIIFVLLLTFFILPLVFKYSEIKVQKIDKIDKDLFEDMKKRGFLSNCFPKNTKNILTAWDIDTNEFYIRFDFEGKEFYSFDQCTLIEKNDVKMPYKKSWIKKIIYPSFVAEMSEKVKSKNDLTSYVSYKDYKLAKGEPLFILIDCEKKTGFAFSD